MTNAFSSKSVRQISWQIYHTLVQNNFKLSILQGMPKGNVPSMCLFGWENQYTYSSFALLEAFHQFKKSILTHSPQDLCQGEELHC